MRRRDARFFVATDGADDRRTERLRPLAGDLSDAAGGGVKEDRLAGLHLVQPAQQVLRDAPAHQAGGCELGRHAGGQFQKAVGRKDTVLDIGTGLPRICNEISYGESRQRPDRLYDAGALHSDYRRQGRRVLSELAGAIVDVDEVDANRELAQQHFAGTRRRNFDFRVLEHFGPAIGPHEHRSGFHFPAPFSRATPRAMTGESFCTVCCNSSPSARRSFSVPSTEVRQLQ